MGRNCYLKYLCVFDMDGTLLDSNHLIPGRNVEALRDLKKMGVGIVLATGRSELMTRKYVRELSLELPIISNNGSLVVDTKNNKVLYKNTFLSETLIKIIKYAMLHDKDYFLYTIDKVLYSPDSKKIKIMHYYNSMVPEDEQIEIVKLPSKIEGVLALLPNNGNSCVFKVLISDQMEEDSEFFEQLDGVEAISSQSDSLDIMPKGSTKGNALLFLSKYLGVDQQNIFAFGDNYNDLSMLEFAGNAIVPANCPDEIKLIADFIVDSNDKAGIAQGVYDYVIPRINREFSTNKKN